MKKNSIIKYARVLFAALPVLVVLIDTGSSLAAEAERTVAAVRTDRQPFISSFTIFDSGRRFPATEKV